MTLIEELAREHLTEACHLDPCLAIVEAGVADSGGLTTTARTAPRNEPAWLAVPHAAQCLSLFRWELEDLAREQLAGMSPQVQLALSDFMDAAVIVDPADYQRRPDEPERPLRTLPFGQAGW